ncbi:MAG: hypothetical protein ACE5FL_11295 [Myxococcota bacterium]
MQRWRAWGAGWVAASLLAGVAAAEVRQIEAEGIVPLAPGARHRTPPRDEAVRRALNEAVRRVALDLVPDLSPESAAEFLPEVLGDEPFVYTTRFRIIEDRGDRPAIASDDPDVAVEYVVLVEAHIDADRVEARLAEAGLLRDRRDEPAGPDVLLVLQGVDDFAAYSALRRTLEDDVRVESALPIRMERNRVVLQVVASRGTQRLLEDLLRAAPPELVITPLDAQDGILTVRIALDPSLAETAPERAPAGFGGPPARD